MSHQWIIARSEGFETSLEYQQDLPIPSAESLREDEVLVRLHAASLNYRDIVMASSTPYGGVRKGVIPGCDGAGVVLATGSSVTDFQAGDRVITHESPETAKARGEDAELTLQDVAAALGHATDGTLRSHGVFHQKALVHAPKNLSHGESAVLTCTYLTAYNILFGLAGKQVQKGSWVLVQGTGGVSIAVLQVASALGANVVATTSSADRAAKLASLGAKHTINYAEVPEWGAKAKELTPDGRGFDIVVDVGGDATLPQSFASVRQDGVVMIIGNLGHASAAPASAMLALVHTCIVRGILAGSRRQMIETVKLVERLGIKPVLDSVEFELADLKSAYRRVAEKKHFAKVVINIE